MTIRDVLLASAAFLPAAAAAGEPAPAPGRPLPATSLGHDVEVYAPPASGWRFPESDPALDPNLPPLAVRLGVPWTALEPAPGEYRWEPLDAAVDAAVGAGREVVLNVYGAHPAHPPSGPFPGAADDEALAAWTSTLRLAALRYASRVRVYQVGRFPDREAAGRIPEAARAYAFLFKKSSVALQAADPGSLVALASVDPGSHEFVSAVYAEEVAAYADALAVAWSGDDAGREGLVRMSGILLASDPGAGLWLTGARVLLGATGYGDLLRAYVAGLEREAALVTVDDPPDAQGRPFHAAAMDRARALFTPAFSPLVESGRGVRAVLPTGAAMPAARAARFLDPDAKTVLMAYDGGPAARRGEFGVFVVEGVDVADPLLRDLASGEASSTVTYQKDPNAGLTRFALPLAEYPLVLSYRRFTTPEYAAEGERLAVTGEKIPTAEEIIARHQAAQDAQDSLIRNVRADWEEVWHFSAGAGGSIDVTWKGTYLLDPNVGAEYVQEEIYVNGVRWKTKTIPELPLIVSERVWTVPLKITFTKDYAYTYEGRQEADGRDCWVVGFESTDPGARKVQGEVYIDTETYNRVRLRQVQGDLPEPIVSNDQTDIYSPVVGPGGYTYWVNSGMRGQTIYSTLGYNLVVNKEGWNRDFVVNVPDFEDRRREALASSHVMLRDTPKGLRYLKHADGGGRVVKDEISHRNLFGVAGFFYDRSLDTVFPLAGFNYFDSDVGGRGAQADLFYAGILLFATISDPTLFGSRFDGRADVTGVAVKLKDRLYRERRGGEVEEVDGERVKILPQSFGLGVGRPFGKYFKLRADGRVTYQDFSRTSETDQAFVAPHDTFVQSARLAADFNRKAWAVQLQHTWSRRTHHEPWGLPDPNTGVIVASPRGDFFEGAEDYVAYQGSISKEFYLPRYQKVLAHVTGFAGRDLDRFSKYRVSFFDTRIRGFSGSGVRFTNGGLAALEYAFNVADIIRFEARVDHARVKDRQLGEDFRDHTGIGIAGQVIGQWGLIYRLDWGIAAASDVEDFRGRQEVLFTVLKLFSQR
jgi:hypothetical protein